jgi:hypothetical protein
VLVVELVVGMPLQHLLQGQAVAEEREVLFLDVYSTLRCYLIYYMSTLGLEG